MSTPVVSVANPMAGTELAAFVAAVEAGSVHGAADALQLTQSAVTKRIQMLERRVGGRLFEHGRFGVRPTELGRTVYPAAKRALEALDSVAQLVELSRAAGSVDLTRRRDSRPSLSLAMRSSWSSPRTTRGPAGARSRSGTSSGTRI